MQPGSLLRVPSVERVTAPELQRQPAEDLAAEVDPAVSVTVQRGFQRRSTLPLPSRILNSPGSVKTNSTSR